MPALVVPLDGAVVDLHAQRQATRELRLDRSSFAVVPAKVRHHVTTSAAAAAVTVVSLLIEPAWLDRAAVEYTPYLEPAKFPAVVAQVRQLVRTRWVDELVQRYVFEREVCDKHASSAARFLEVELTKELYFLGTELLERQTRTSVVFEGDPISSRARAWLDERLFEPFAMAALARHCSASASTVLRAFRRDVGVAPAVYVRRRRLEEALHLLEGGRYAVTEVAARVGYDNPSAFAVAFKAQFGVSPSQVRARIAPGTLPAFGRPPR